MNERDPPSTTILQEGKNMLTTTFQTQQGFMGEKKIPHLCTGTLIQRCKSIL